MGSKWLWRIIGLKAVLVPCVWPKPFVRSSKRSPPTFACSYPDTIPLAEKVRIIAREIYRAEDVEIPSAVHARFAELEKNGFGHFPICMAKTQYSFSTDPAKKGAPTGFTLPVREVRLAMGAGFVVVITGDMMTMPGLPRVPAAQSIGIDAKGNIVGLFWKGARERDWPQGGCRSAGISFPSG